MLVGTITVTVTMNGDVRQTQSNLSQGASGSCNTSQFSSNKLVLIIIDVLLQVKFLNVRHCNLLG